MSHASDHLDTRYDGAVAYEDELDPDDFSAGETQMRTHVRVIGAIHLAMASGLVLAAVIVALTVGGGGLLSGDPKTIGITSGVVFGINLVLLALAVPGLFAGFGLLALRPWARPVGIVLGVLHLPGVPIGTAFGVYSLWALTHADTPPVFTPLR